MKRLFAKSMRFKMISFLLIVAMLNVSVGCNYYKVATAQSALEGVRQIDANKYVIIHFQTDEWAMSKLVFDDANQVLKGYKATIATAHRNHETPEPKGNRFKPRLESPDNEIHVYIDEYETLEDGSIAIPVSGMNRVDVYDYQVGATIASYVFTTLGILTGLYLIVMIIVLLTKSSCPFVYAFDGENYRFYGEMFGGAISQNMQRDDYMPIPGLTAQNDLFKLKITNELKERQYTDIAELMYFEHPKGVSVLFDKTGKYHTVKDARIPLLARSDNGNDLMRWIGKKDSLTYDFQDESKENADFSAINLNFSKPKNADNAKLILTLKNSLWMDYIFGKFIEQFGEGYAAFAEKQKSVPAEKKTQWSIDQGMIMTVKIKTRSGWKVIDHLNMVGPLAQRDILIPIDLKGMKEEILEVRLDCGYHFWELDYAAIDYSKDLQLEQKTIKPAEATDEYGTNVLASLLETDNNYLSQLNVGCEALINYKVPALKDPKNDFSVLFHTRGYYEYIRDFTGKPNVEELKKFRKKGYFTHFAKQNFSQFTTSIQ